MHERTFWKDVFRSAEIQGNGNFRLVYTLMMKKTRDIDFLNEATGVNAYVDVEGFIWFIPQYTQISLDDA